MNTAGGRTLSRRDFGRLALVAGGSLILVGCTSDSDSESNGTNGATSTGTFGLLHDFEYLGTPGSMPKFFGSALERFEGVADVQTEDLAVAYQDLLPRIQSFNAAKSGATAITYYSQFNTFQYIDFLQPIDDLVGGEEEMQHWRSRIRPFNGKTHFSPYIYEVNALVANLQVLDNAGVTLPERFESWEAFIAAIDQVVAAGSPGYLIGASDNIQPGVLGDMFLMEVLEDPIHMSEFLAGQRDNDEPIARIWIDRLADLATGERSNANRNDLTHAQAVERFAKGEGAFCNMFKAQATALDADIFQVIPFWQGTGPLTARIAVAGDGIFVTNYGDNAVAAGEFLKWLHQPEQLQDFYEATGEFPCDDRFELDSGNPLEQTIFEEIASNEPTPPYWPSEYFPADIVVSGINPIGGKVMGGQGADETFTEWTSFLEQWRSANSELNDSLKEFIVAVNAG